MELRQINLSEQRCMSNSVSSRLRLRVRSSYYARSCQRALMPLLTIVKVRVNKLFIREIICFNGNKQIANIYYKTAKL